MKHIFYTVIVLIATFSLQNCNLLSAAGIGSQAQPVKQVQGILRSTTANSQVNVDHSQWDGLLKKHVDAKGFVNYKSFKMDDSLLVGYLEMLAKQEPNMEWSVQELLAYYINLYNAQTVKLINDNYPLKSIKDINGAWTKGIAKVGSKKLSLGGIENGILRKMNEPRIHFAINCASISCPKLLNEAFTASKINEQLEVVTVGFINSDKNELSSKNPKLSSIFKFYTDDFKVNGKTDLVGYVNKYSKTKLAPTATVSFKEYNWNLNQQ